MIDNMEIYKKLPKAIPLMRLHITPFLSYRHACACVEGLIDSKKKAFSVAINPEKLFKAENDQKLADLINNAQMFICDGIGAAIACFVLHGRFLKRITGVSLFYEVIKVASTKGWKLYLLGASSDVNDGACKNLLVKYPDLQIVGNHDGYFDDSETVIREVNDSGADILFVAMGSPKQESWIAENRDMINASFCMGVGGTFDVVSGKVKWAPAFFRKTGTEWLYRLLSEPKRWRRQLALPKFLWLLLKYKLARK
jgi:N-acetylglucosaminyldiphosphoundecaprenol N-acetyl-beta-D-mannosaminyltransferase